METLKPASEDQLREAVAWACGGGHSLEIVSGSSAPTLGRPVQATHRLDVSAISGIVSYQPGELVLTARAGTPLTEIEHTLAERGQQLAFEPARLNELSGSRGHEVTLGGMVATGLSGPRRIRMGAVRDHVLGISAVSGRGEAFKSGGKVIKNVTGYDVPKLLTGSHGTLAVMHEITIKTLPAPEHSRTLLIRDLDPTRAVRALTEALQMPVEVSGACHVPAELSVAHKPEGVAVTALRLEGFRASVDDRMAALQMRFTTTSELGVLEHEACGEFWLGLRDALPFAHCGDRPVWRISVPPAQGARIFERLRVSLPASHGWLDWGGGLIWLSLDTPEDAHPNEIRAAFAETGGHATLVNGSSALRSRTEVFEPQSPAIAALSRRVKTQFDPAGILNPGRMYAGS